jgi:multidrug efflux pump subunit AcrA (membrane-fusion protein)
MTKNQTLFAAFLLFALLAPACSGGRNEATPTPVPTPAVIQKPTYQVQRGTVTKIIQLQGRVAPVNQQDLFFRTDGYVSRVVAARGGAVKAGEVLAELELGDLDIQLSQAQLSLQQAEARLAQAQKENADQLIEARMALEKANLQAVQAGALGINPSIEEAEAALERAKRSLDNAERENELALKNSRLRNKEKEEFQKKVDLAKAAVAAAERRLESAKEQDGFEETLASVQAAQQEVMQAYREALSNPETSEAEREALRQQLEEAKAAYVEAWLEYADIVAGPTYLSANARLLARDVALARLRVEELKLGIDPLVFLDVEQRRLDLETVQQKVDRARLIAPFDGQILSLSLTPGSQAAAFRPVLTLADPTELEIAARPTPEDLSVLGVGQAASVQLLSQGSGRFPGHIRLLPLSSEAGDQEGDQVAYITLDDPDVPLTLGEAATIVIEVERREDALWIPPAALRTFQGRDFVFVLENGVQRRVDVRLGLRSAEQVEILAGLTEGQTVVGP